MITSKTTPVRDGANTFCESQLFQDFDEWTKAFRTWNLTTTQLDRGKFKGELAIAQFGCLQFIYASSNQALQIVGGKPPKAIVLATPLFAPNKPNLATATANPKANCRRLLATFN